MSKRQSLRALVNERLTAAAEEIFALVEKTIAEYEEELCRCKAENHRKQEILEELQKTRGGGGEGDDAVPRVKLENCDDEPETDDSQDDAVPKVKLENCDEPEIHDSQGIQVKNEDSEPANPLEDTDVAMETHDEDTSTTETWTAPLNGEIEATDGEVYPCIRKVSKFKDGIGPIKYTCRVCKKQFKRSGYLKRHEKVHERGPPGVKLYSCSVCDRRFRVKEYVEVHMRTHTGELPYSCTLCENKRYATKSALNLHMQTTHSQDRPFSCVFCKSDFKLKGHLREHMLRHTEFRPLNCTFCGKGYWRKRELQNHQRRCIEGGGPSV